MPGRATLERFDYKKSEQYILSIRLSADGFSFVIYNPQHYCFLESITKKTDNSISLLANFKQAYQEIDFLSYKYKQVYVLVVDKRFTFVPLEIFEEDHKQEVFYYNFPQKDNELVCSNVLVNNDCVVLFGLDKNYYTFINEKHPNTAYFSQSVALTEYFSVKSRAVRLKQIFACLRGNCVDLYCFDHGRVSLINSYGDCNQPADMSYYILYVWKQLSMDQLTDELYVLGETTGKDELLEILKNFIKEVAEFEIEAELGDFFSETVSSVPYDIQILMSQKKLR